MNHSPQKSLSAQFQANLWTELLECGSPVQLHPHIIHIESNNPLSSKVQSSKIWSENEYMFNQFTRAYKAFSVFECTNWGYTYSYSIWLPKRRKNKIVLQPWFHIDVRSNDGTCLIFKIGLHKIYEMIKIDNYIVLHKLF